MRILMKGVKPWVGVEINCGVCKTKFELDDMDPPPQNIYGRYVPCPICASMSKVNC